MENRTRTSSENKNISFAKNQSLNSNKHSDASLNNSKIPLAGKPSKKDRQTHRSSLVQQLTVDDADQNGWKVESIKKSTKNVCQTGGTKNNDNKTLIDGVIKKENKTNNINKDPSRKDSKESQQLVLMFGMDEFTSLAQAVHERDRKRVETLLTQGEDPNVQLSTGLFRGCIPLHLAALYGDTSIIEMLIKYNSKLDEINIFGETALDFAKEQGQDKAVDCLMRYNAKTGREVRSKLCNQCTIL